MTHKWSCRSCDCMNCYNITPPATQSNSLYRSRVFSILQVFQLKFCFACDKTRMAYNFITEPDPNLKCVICLELASQPKQCEDCGKLFCSDCIEKNGRKPCPNCRTVNPKYFKDVRGKMKILYRVCNLMI